MPSLRRRARLITRTPFVRLVGHFLTRLAHTNHELGWGALLGLLAAPGAFLCMLQFDRYSSLLRWYAPKRYEDLYAALASDEFMFLAVAMAVTGIVTVLRWERILPDAQDYLNLVPLPLTRRTILLANATATVIAVLVVAVVVNAVSLLLFPVIVASAVNASFPEFVHFMAVHSVCVILASVFTFCAVFASLGLVAALTSRRIYRILAPGVRAAALIAFLVLLANGFDGARILHSVAVAPESPLRWVPAVWFVSLYRSLQHCTVPAFAGLVPLVWKWLAVACGLALVAYALGARRRFASVLEGERTPSRRSAERALLAVLGGFAPRAMGFPRAVFQFVNRGLLRNENPRLCVAVTAGLAWLLAAESLARGGLCEAPLCATYVLVLGLSIALDMDASGPATWIFRVTVEAREQETAGAVRRVMTAWLALGVAAPTLAGSLVAMSAAQAMVHTLYVLLLAAALVEFRFAGYRRMPFSAGAQREQLLLTCLLEFAGYLAYTGLGGRAEAWLFRRPAGFVVVPLVLLPIVVWNHRRLRDEVDNGERAPGMTFENLPEALVERLDLYC